MAMITSLLLSLLVQSLLVQMVLVQSVLLLVQPAPMVLAQELWMVQV